MKYIAVTHFDKETWAKYGLNWLRKAKSEGLKGYILGTDLPEEAPAKANELGFTAVPVVGPTGAYLDRYHTLASVLKEGQRCLLTWPTVLPKGGLSDARDVLCGTEKKLNVVEIVAPVKNLYNRAKVVRDIRDKIITTHHSLLSPRCVLGTWDFWNEFLGFQSYLYERDYVDLRLPYNEELLLNLYLAEVDHSLEVDGDARNEKTVSA